MLAAQALYGPDDTASARFGTLALGRNLFRLLPEDVHDRQPLVGGNGRFALVADVRLDNRYELHSALGLDGRAASLADSDILLLALENWGEAGLDRIVGDYAFAFFDMQADQLMLARSPLGQRPLFWHRGKGFLAFSSMPKGLHAAGDIERRADPVSVERFVGLIPQIGTGSYYEGVQRVEPGHVVTITSSGSRTRRHWNPQRRTLRLKSFGDYVEAFRMELDRAVASRLRGADGKVAAHLSGGWDSSAVAATAARLLAPAGGRVMAFTAVPRNGADAYGPLGRFADEGPIAAKTAAMHDNIDHFRIESSGRSPIADLDLYADAFERPSFNICNHVWLSDIRSAARAQGARVMLTGEIGNWTISASPSALLADYLREGRWLGWWREATAIARRPGTRLRGIAATSLSPWLPAFAWKRLRRLQGRPGLRLQSALHPGLRKSIGREQEAYDFGRAGRPNDHFRNSRDALLEMDFGEYRKGVLGGWGIDKRDATADRRLVEFCLSLPVDMLLKGGIRRPLARAALSDRLPATVLDERGKGYQASDWHVGLTRDLPAVTALIDAIAADPVASGIVDIDALRALVREWPKAGWEDPQIIARYRVALLQALSAGHFLMAAAHGRSGGHFADLTQ